MPKGKPTTSERKGLYLFFEEISQFDGIPISRDERIKAFFGCKGIKECPTMGSGLPMPMCYLGHYLCLLVQRKGRKCGCGGYQFSFF